MLILAKSTPDWEVEFKKRLGFKNIEIQLVKETASDENYSDVISYENIDIKSVHTPLQNNEDVEINTITNQYYYNMLIETCKLAQLYAEHYKHDVIVVLHNAWSKSNWETHENYRLIILEKFQEIISKYPDLKFAIENTMPYKDDFSFRPGGEVEDIKFIVDYLNENIPGQKFGTLLDICHYLILYRAKKKIFKDFELSLTDFLEDAFKTLGNTLIEIHLNNCYLDGLGEDHGRFLNADNKRDIDILTDILTFQQKYSNNPLLCLEVAERDYRQCFNLVETYKALLVVAKNLGIHIEK